MTVVVNSNQFITRFETLGWNNIHVNDVVSQIAARQIPSSIWLAYLDALIASQAGLDDSTIPGVSAVQGGRITTFFQALGVLL